MIDNKLRKFTGNTSELIESEYYFVTTNKHHPYEECFIMLAKDLRLKDEKNEKDENRRTGMGISNMNKYPEYYKTADFWFNERYVRKATQIEIDFLNQAILDGKIPAKLFKKQDWEAVLDPTGSVKSIIRNINLELDANN